jgi:hypothetical protein
MEVLLTTATREEPMDARKYEKLLDNRSAALVSREGRAPRAGQDRKPWMVKELRLISLLIMSRGAQVSRAARRSERAAQAHAAKRHRTRLRDLNLKASQERGPVLGVRNWRLETKF